MGLAPQLTVQPVKGETLGWASGGLWGWSDLALPSSFSITLCFSRPTDMHRVPFSLRIWKWSLQRMPWPVEVSWVFMANNEAEWDEGDSSSLAPWYILVHRSTRRLSYRFEQIQALAMKGLWFQGWGHRLKDNEWGQAYTSATGKPPPTWVPRNRGRSRCSFFSFPSQGPTFLLGTMRNGPACVPPQQAGRWKGESTSRGQSEREWQHVWPSVSSGPFGRRHSSSFRKNKGNFHIIHWL